MVQVHGCCFNMKYKDELIKSMNYLAKNDKTIFENEPLEYTSSINQLIAFRHSGFWQCMDTLRDKKLLDKLWKEKNALWKVW